MGLVSSGSALLSRLRSSLLQQRWFNSDVFVSCFQEFVENITPTWLRRDLEGDVNLTNAQWSFAQSYMQEHAPQWFKDAHDQASAPKVKDANQASSGGAAPLEYRSSQLTFHDRRQDEDIWNVLTKVAGTKFWRYAWQISGEQIAYGFIIRFVRFPRNNELEIPARFLDARHWTVNHLLFLDYLKSPKPYFHMVSEENTAALSRGLMSAIQQAFVSAVVLISSTQWERGVSAACSRLASSIADDICKETGRMINEEQSHYWRLISAEQIQCGRNGSYITSGTVCNPTNKEHLKCALLKAMVPEADEITYVIFCWLSLAYFKKQIAEGAAYPEDTIQLLHSLILSNEGEKVKGMECYKFFSDTALKLWRASAEPP